MSLLAILSLFFTGFLAGFVDTLAGGGGLITVPVLISMGIEPQCALGTNKLQASFGSGSATMNFILEREINVKECLLGVTLTFTGSAIGTIVVQQISSNFLRLIIPLLLFCIAIYSLLNPTIGIKERKPKMSKKMFYLAFSLTLGFYDGFFGPGTGSFWAMAYILFLGYDLRRATYYTKLMNFTSNIASLLFFIFGKKVYYSVGLTMAAGQILGAKIGSKLIIKKGATFIKPIFITMVFVLTIKLIIDSLKKFF